MRRTVLAILVSFIYTLCMGQTTIINGSWTSGTTECGRLKSVEIQDNGVVVTIEVKALKALKRLQIFSTYKTYITSGEYPLLQLSGLVVGNEIKSCGSGTNWGWDKVAIGETRSYQLFFKGTLPPGITTISIIDKGDYNGAHGYCFMNFNINNPRKNYSSINSEYLAKKNIDSNNDGICGIYEQIAGEQNYKLACIKENGQHKLIYLSSSTGITWWQPGDIKANLRASASGIFKADWFMSNKSVNKDAYLIFDGLSMTLNMPTGTDPGETKYLKMYPENSPGISGGSNTNQGSSWTGTGFALKNGYIVTNNHVVDGASSILVQGINGSSVEYKAEVVAVDKNNDLALIRINDYRFDGFGSIPYSIKETLCDVGSDVFVLGYPLTNYMGEEIKLTNGIISSRSGYQGDITTYQISAPVQPGNSGGPMFDKNGNVVGVVNAGIPGAENVGYAIKTSYLCNLINSSVSSTIIPRNNTISAMSLSEKVKVLRNYTFYIKCK
jgi:S1-C subfamily serine protease